MLYERYQVIKSFEEFYENWTSGLEKLSSQTRKTIYDEYVTRCLVYQRDEFKCRNETCTTPTSKVTIHHIRFQSNKGRTTVKNCVLICKSCQSKFHSDKEPLTFNGAIYRTHNLTLRELNTEMPFNYKKARVEGRMIRKENVKYKGIIISWELLLILMKFLEINYEDLKRF